ncbi:hypothetical protein QF001_000183 [Paraburkholderia youngii]
MILFDDVIQILFLADPDRHLPPGVDRLKGSQIRWALSGWGYCKDAAGCVKAQHHEASIE